jgi:hypothetical protein
MTIELTNGTNLLVEADPKRSRSNVKNREDITCIHYVDPMDPMDLEPRLRYIS